MGAGGDLGEEPPGVSEGAILWNNPAFRRGMKQQDCRCSVGDDDQHLLAGVGVADMMAEGD
jgi:hypothetical protein